MMEAIGRLRQGILDSPLDLWDWRAANHHDHDTLLAGIVNCPRITILYAFLPQWSTMAANRAISCEQRSLAIPHWHPGQRV